MKRRRVLRRRIVVAVLLVLSVAMLTLFFRESDHGPTHTLQAGVLQIVAPLQEGTSVATKPFRDGWNWVVGLFRANSENAALRDEVEELRASLAQELLTQAENKELRAVLNMRDGDIFPDGAKFVSGRVVARSTTAWYSTVTIDVGKDDGVAVYDAVVNGSGLVGRVTSVTSDAAQVTLITDQQSFVDAVVLPDGAEGILAGSVTGDLTLGYVDKSERVKVGEYVVTSGREGSIFVRGIPIGSVESVGSQEVELYQNIAIKPFVDFRKLDIVQVVID
ncbi:MAG: rod shape-determining protein MreC [Thermoleophilia bacterium]